MDNIFSDFSGNDKICIYPNKNDALFLRSTGPICSSSMSWSKGYKIIDFLQLKNIMLTINPFLLHQLFLFNAIDKRRIRFQRAAQKMIGKTGAL